LFIS
jgi:hypothetical protein